MQSNQYKNQKISNFNSHTHTKNPYKTHSSAIKSILLGILIFGVSESYAQVTDTSAAEASKCDPYEKYDCLESYLGNGFWERLKNYYQLEWGKAIPPADPAAPISRREDWPPAAQSIPPMPFTEWPYGGTTALGATRANSVDSPLMTALGNTDFGKWMNDNHLQMYGWANVGANISTSTVRGGNAPAAYSYDPNKFQLDQLVMYLDRFPDTVQKDHIDWGLRVSAIYGSNYRYTTSYGLVSDQLLRYNKANGYDFPMLYGEVFIPWVAEGLMIRAGRFISLPDIEAQLAPNNYMYSHSMTYAYDNYTNTGVMGSLAISKNAILQAGITVGTESTINHLNQTAPNPFPNNPSIGQYNPLYPGNRFKVDPGSKPSLTLCGRFNSDNGKTDFNLCANGINSGEYGYNNLQWYGATFYHQFDEHWHIASEIYNEHQNNVPNANNSVVQNIYANGGSPFSSSFMPFNAPNLAQCRGSSVLTCKASATGFVTYLNYSPDPLNNFSIRPELFFDPQGQRTGTAAKYTNLAFGWQHWLSPQLEIRPEIAFYHANQPAFNGNSNAGISPNKNHATIVSADLIFHW